VTTISILIVSWNSRAYLEGCLESIRSAKPSCVEEIIVVDNASTDGSPEMVEQRYAEVRLIRAGANLGFAKGNNLAIRHARGSLLALVNSDALVHAGCLEQLADYMDNHPEVGLVGPRVIGGDGLLQRTSRHLPGVWNTLCRALALDRMFAGRWVFGGYEASPTMHEISHDAEVLSGCFCVARGSAVEQVGGLDERFFFYGEDIDWCRRLRDAGWRLVFLPQALATHFGGGSSSRTPARFSIEMLRATLIYWRKHHSRAGAAVCRLLLIVHHGVRFLVRLPSRWSGSRSAHGDPTSHQQDYLCLRWLFFGTEVDASR
jgi:GT2 family glycosyltransferase